MLASRTSKTSMTSLMPTGPQWKPPAATTSSVWMTLKPKPAKKSRPPSRKPRRCGTISLPMPRNRPKHWWSRAAAESERERQKAFLEMRHQIVALAVSAAGKVVGESLDGERQNKLVDDFIGSVGSGNVMEAGRGVSGKRYRQSVGLREKLTYERRSRRQTLCRGALCRG